jgi:hypothetical protein
MKDITIIGDATKAAFSPGTGTYSVLEGDEFVLTITPATGFKVDYLNDGDVSVASITEYRISEVVSDRTLTASLVGGTQATVTITPTYNAGGALIPATATTILYGRWQQFVPAATSGYYLSDVKKDGVSIGPVSICEFEQATVSHTVEAVFSNLGDEPNTILLKRGPSTLWVGETLEYGEAGVDRTQQCIYVNVDPTGAKPATECPAAWLTTTPSGVPSHTQPASSIELLEIGTSTYDDVQDFVNIVQSGGRISGGIITATSPATGTIAVSAMKGFVKITDSEIAVTKFFDYAGVTAWGATGTGTTLTDNSVNYLYIDYNAGTPVLKCTTDRSTILLTSQFTLGRVFKSGNDIEVLMSGINLPNRTRRIHERWVDTFGGVSRANGVVVGATGINPKITAGVFYAGSNKISISALDCNGAGRFTAYYYNPTTAAWVTVANQASLDNLRYNKTDTGTGLETLSANNRYAVHWIYVCPEGEMYVLYGQANYDLTQAQAATVPTTLIPPYLAQWAVLAAKVIIVKSGTSTYSITSAWSNVFPVQIPGDHNGLAGLQGGTTDQYYHLTAAQNTQIAGVGIASGTLATQSIYVDQAAAGTGTGVNWTDAFTTIQASINSLPAIINHAVTIYVRKGSTAYAASTLQRLVGDGSITIQGEYYFTNAVASAGSGNGKFNANASDSGILAGDKVYLQRFSGAVGASPIDLSLSDTVASVSGAEVTLTTNTGQAFSASWRYIICRTETGAIIGQNTNNAAIRGVHINSGASPGVTIIGCNNPLLYGIIVETTTGTPITTRNVFFSTTSQYIGIVCGASTGSAIIISCCLSGYGVTALSVISALSGALTYGSGRGHILVYSSMVTVSYGGIRGTTGCSADGVICGWGSNLTLSNLYFDGFDATYKMPTIYKATGAAAIAVTSCANGTNYTTLKTPANWAASTDGSFIS